MCRHGAHATRLLSRWRNAGPGLPSFIQVCNPRGCKSAGQVLPHRGPTFWRVTRSGNCRCGQRIQDRRNIDVFRRARDRSRPKMVVGANDEAANRAIGWWPDGQEALLFKITADDVARLDDGRLRELVGVRLESGRIELAMWQRVREATTRGCTVLGLSGRGHVRPGKFVPSAAETRARH